MRLKVLRAQFLVKRRKMSKAARTLLSNGTADFSDEVIAMLDRLHPDASQPVGPVPPTAAFIGVDADTVVECAKRMANGSAAGPSGWNGELLLALCSDEVCLDGLVCLVRDIVNGAFAGCPAVRSLLLSSRLVGLWKDDPQESDQQDDDQQAARPPRIRPIAIPEAIMKLAEHVALTSVRDGMADIFGDLQLALGYAGGVEAAIHKMVAAIQGLGSESYVMCFDAENAFNTRRRADIMREVYSYPALQPIYRMLHWSLDGGSPLLMVSRGEVVATLSSDEGVRQGSVLGPLAYAISMHRLYREVLGRNEGVVGTAILDDFSGVASGQQGLGFFDDFLRTAANADITVRLDKSFVLWPRSTPHPAWLEAECRRIGVELRTGGSEYLGSFIGSDDLASEFALRQVDRHDELFDLLTHDDMLEQAGLLILRSCMIPKANYLTRTLPPSASLEAMSRFDEKVVRTASVLCDLPEPLSELSSLLLTMPLREAGFGLRSMQDTAPAAYLSSLALAAPLVVAQLPTPDQRADGPTAAALDSCYVLLQDTPLETIDIPTTAARFWATYGRRAGYKLQNSIMRLVGTRLFQRALGLASQSQQALLRSMRVPGAAAWLTAVPSCRELTLYGAALRGAAHLRLLIPMGDGQPLCSGTGCRADLTVDEQHGHACPVIRRRAVTARHDDATNQLAHNMTRAGGQVIVEHGMGGDRLDVDAMFDRRELVDVSYVSPSAPTYSAAASMTALSAARSRERAKIARYWERADAEGAFLGPFVMEITGALGPMASRYLTLLARRIAEQPGETTSAAQIRTGLLQRLAICTQRGNARIAASWRQHQGLAVRSRT